ncbi:MAG: tetratricopeptide repeat protein [Persicimonas sp.]
MLGASLVVVVALFVGLASANAQGPNDYHAQARGLEQQIAQLEDSYLKPALLRSRYKIEARFNDAKVAYLLEDYTRASILFVGLVDNPDAENLDSYREALYLLGESLYEQRNFLAARTYYDKVVTRGRGRFYQDSVKRLLELAARTGDYQGVDDLYDALDSQSGLSPGVHYVRGKTLYKQQRYAEARRSLQQAAKSPRYALRAGYFRGITFAAEEQYDNAMQVFEQLVDDHEADSPETRNLIDLVYLGMGRVSYEQEDYEQAIDFYGRLKRDSDHFDQMLYELTWTFIAQEKYEAASRVTDIFLYLSNPDPTFVPKVKLLKADLHLRLQQYERAKATYDDVVGSFTPVKDELEEFTDQKQDLRAFFEELVEAEMRGERPRYMPRLVQQWIEGSEELDQAKLNVSDLARVRRDIEASYSDLEQMEARLESGARVESFPALAEGMALAVEVESRLVSLRQDMIEEQYNVLSSKMTDTQEQEWERLEAQVSKLRERYKEMPKSQADVRERARHIEERFTQLRRNLDEVTFQIDNQSEQLDAIDDYLDDPDRHSFSAEEMRELEEKRAEARATISQLRDLKAALQQETEVARQRVGMGDEAMVREQQVRKQYRRKLAEQREFLEQVDTRGSADGSQQLEELQQARQILPRVESRLQGFFSRMNELVGERADELTRDLVSERKMLTMLDQEVASLMGESKQVTAVLAYHSFQQVKRDFQDLIMRGDIGLIDVAWQKKEDTTRSINQLFEDRTAELKTLQEAFDEVR